MASTLVGDYATWLAEHYGIFFTSSLKIPFTFSIFQGEFSTDKNGTSAPGLKYSNTYIAYNNRRGETLRLQRIGAADADETEKVMQDPSGDPAKGVSFKATTYSLSFSLYLYDILWNKLGKNPWELGLARDLYSYENTKLISGSITMSYDSNGTYILTSDQNQVITFYLYSTITGKLDTQFDVGILPDDTDFAVYAQGLFVSLRDAARDFSNSTKYLELSPLFGLVVDTGVSSFFTEETADSHNIVADTYMAADANKTLQMQGSLFTSVAAPIRRLNRISVLDTGTWSFYPLGSSPAECTARKLGMPFNNKNYTSDFPNAGVTQMLEAAEQDTMYAFISDPLNANVNYADLRSISQAVVSYAKVMAADICSSKYLPRSVVPYVAAKIEYYLFTVKTLPADIEGALTTVLGYILQDYSINDTVANARAYYEKCRDITSFFGTFYTVCGVNVQRLGVNSTNFANVMAEYKEYQRLFLEIAYVRELNQLAITAKSTGSFELLDKTKTIYPRLQSDVYLGMNSQTMICSDVTISITNKPSMSVSANYIKRLEVG